MDRSEEHTSELQSLAYLVCRLLLEKKKKDVAHSTSPASRVLFYYLFFFFNDTATTEIYTLSLHDALPILRRQRPRSWGFVRGRRSPHRAETARSTSRAPPNRSGTSGTAGGAVTYGQIGRAHV